MDFLNGFICELKKLQQNTDNDVYLYGAGGLAVRIKNILDKNNIRIDGYIIDDGYLPLDENKRFIDGVPMISAQNGITKNCVIIPAFMALTKENEEKAENNEFVEKFYDIDFGGIFAMNDINVYDDEFITQNADKFIDLFNKLSDFESRKALVMFTAQKYTGMFRKNHSKAAAYFDKDIVRLEDNEIFVDCGAYTGDTVIQFIKEMNLQGVIYNKIYAFEADDNNFKIMRDGLKNLKNIEQLPIGVWEKKDTLHFNNSLGLGSKISDEGIELKVDAIDNIIGSSEKVTFIKMDIEGSELKALKGAEKTILKHKPKLAICVYHKPEDLITIPQYILSLNPNYKLYLRNYSSSAVETVLYAIP